MGKKLEIKDFTDAKYQDSLKDDAMAKAIKEGVKDGDKTRMKAFGEKPERCGDQGLGGLCAEIQEVDFGGWGVMIIPLPPNREAAETV